MDNIFYLQLLTSFLIGGGAIALLSLVAEKAPPNISGIILSLPSTVVIGLFFIGLVSSPEEVVKAIPVLILTSGYPILFAIAYVYVAQKFSKKLISMGISVFLALTVWFCLAIPLAVYQFDNTSLGILGYFLCVLIGHYFLSVKPKINQECPPDFPYTFGQKMIRFVFAGSVIAVAVYLSKTLNVFWGNLFSGFPAVYTSTLLILHYNRGSEFLFRIAKRIPAGSSLYLLYPIVVSYVYPAFGIWWGTFVSYATTLILFIIFMRIFRCCQKSS